MLKRCPVGELKEGDDFQFEGQKWIVTENRVGRYDDVVARAEPSRATAVMAADIIVTLTHVGPCR